MIIAGLVAALGVAVATVAGAAPTTWRYVVPPPGDPFESPPLRSIGLASEKPEDLIVKVTFRGSRQRYARLRYGSPSSVRMTIVLDEIGRGEADLYVDANRNRRIEWPDRVAGENRTWRLPLDLAIVEGETTRYERRALIFRLGATGITFSHAASGYLDGKVEFAGHCHAVRRVYGDGNGLFTDLQDCLWIDLNDDGRWDSSSEQFLFASILTIGDARYAVRSDPFGEAPLTRATGGQRHRPSRPRKARGYQPQLSSQQRSSVETARRSAFPASPPRPRFRSENTGWVPSPLPSRMPNRGRVGTSCSPTSAAGVRPVGTRSSRAARSRSTRSAT